MFGKSLKLFSQLLCVGALSLVLYGCNNAPAPLVEDEHNVQNLQENSGSNEAGIPSFETIIADLREKSINSFENSMEKTANVLREGDTLAEGTGKLSIGYGDTNGSISFHYSGSMDSTLEKIFGYFSLGFGLDKANIFDEDVPEHIGLSYAANIFKDKLKYFINIGDIGLDDIKSIVINKEEGDELWNNINSLKSKIQGKWIELNQEKICDVEGDDYSEEGCDILESFQNFVDTLSGIDELNANDNENVQEIIKTINAVFKAGSASLFSTGMLTNPELVQYEEKPAYKFGINQSLLKKDVKNISMELVDYYRGKVTEKFENKKQENEDFWMTEEEIKNLKSDALEDRGETFDEILEKINIDDFVGYLVYNGENDYDLVIEKLDILIHNEDEICSYGDYNGDDWEYSCEPYEENFQLSIGFSSKNHSLVAVISEDDEVVAKITLKYIDSEDESEVEMSIASSKDEDDNLIEDLIKVGIKAGNKKTEKTIDNNFSFFIKLKKELLGFFLDQDVSVEFDSNSTTRFGEKFKYPSITSSMSFSEANKLLEDLNNTAKSRDSQRRSDISRLSTAIITYYNETGKFPFPNSPKMLSSKKLEGKLTYDGISFVDPLETNTFKYDGVKFVGEYGYKTMTKNSVKNGGFILMAKAETPTLANFVSGIPINDLAEVELCHELVKGDKTSTEVRDDGVCTYASDDDLRHLYIF